MSLDLDSEHAASETLKKLDDLTSVNIMTLTEEIDLKNKHSIDFLKMLVKKPAHLIHSY